MQYISTSDYDYELPLEKIALYPLCERDASRLLIYNSEKIDFDVFSNLDKYLAAKSLLIYNDSKVIHARLLFQKETGASIEIFCLEPLMYTDINKVLYCNALCIWKCLVGNAKKWKDEILKKEIFVDNRSIFLEARKLEANKDEYTIQFKWYPNKINFSEILKLAGLVPLPPYIYRIAEEIDRTRYQTIYSSPEGSVAAPTAGLHFTPSVFEKLENKEILYKPLTLHVGAGTFIPVKANNAVLHQMHEESFIIKKDLIADLILFGGNITAVGTTTLRALESIYLCGVKLIENTDEPFVIDQWEAYSSHSNHSTEKVLNRLIDFCNESNKDIIFARTRLMIIPGYNFKIVNRLITNFHQPKSTLLMLVAAFAGNENWKKIYKSALENNFRFLSYGDSSLLIRNIYPLKI